MCMICVYIYIYIYLYITISYTIQYVLHIVIIIIIYHNTNEYVTDIVCDGSRPNFQVGSSSQIDAKAKPPCPSLELGMMASRDPAILRISEGPRMDNSW